MFGKFVYRPVGITKIFLPFLVCIALVLIVQAAISYQLHKTTALEKELKDMEKKVELAVKDAEFMRKTARVLAVQIFFDKAVQGLLFKDLAVVDYDKYIKPVDLYRSIYPFLSSVYIYNGNDYFAIPSYEGKYDKNNFSDSGVNDLIANFSEDNSSRFFARSVPSLMYPMNSLYSSQYTNVYTYVFSDSTEQDGGATEAIVLNFDEDWLGATLDSLNKNGDHIFVIDAEGNLVSRDTNYTIGTNLSDLPYIQRVLNATETSGDFKMKIDGEATLVHYASSSMPGWKFVLLKPYSYVIGGFQGILAVTCLTALSILLFGGLGVFYFSRRLYVPWQYMYMENNQLKAENRENYVDARNDYLKSLVMGHTTKNGNSRKQFNIDLKDEGSFLQILLRVDGYSDFCRGNNYEERKLIKYAATNILTEMLSACMPCECIDSGDDQIIAILTYDGDQPESDERLRDIFSCYFKYMEMHLNVSFSIVVSQVYFTLSESLNTYQELFEASFDRFLKGYGCVLFYNGAVREHFTYPIDKEKQICEALTLDHIDEAKAGLSELLVQLASYGSTGIQVYLLRFLLAVHNVMEICFQNNQNLIVNYNFNESLTTIRSIETLDKMQEFFFTLFDGIHADMEEKKDSRHSQIVLLVEEEIKKNYGDVNLSMETLAKQAGLSQYYLGKIFKSYKAVSLPNFISNVRLQKSYELLLSGQISIDEVMRLTGFVSRSNFYTLFKKAYGVTPNQCRKVQKE